MKNDDNIVEFDDLKTYFFTDNGVVKAVNGVTFEVPKNSIVGIVGTLFLFKSAETAACEMPLF